MGVRRPEAVRNQLNELRDLPERESMTLVDNGSIQQTIMRQAIDESDAQPGDVVDQYWLADEGFVVIDLRSDHE